MQAKLKKELLERLTANGLLYEELNLSGREIIIHEVTGHSSRKIGMISMQIEHDTKLDENLKNALFTLYVPLVACSEGDLPESYDSFFWMKDSDIEIWTKHARLMNPKIFLLLDEQEKRLESYISEIERKKKADQEIEKKKKKRTTSKRS